VPIGCNHRLCPLCAYHRSTKARKRIKGMFDRLTHPALITLTIPNLKSIRKHDYTLFRQKARKFLKQRGAWIKGGVYSLETTYNRKECTWHIHAHVLADLAAALPTKKQKIDLAGQRVYAFTAMKLRLEFDWLRLWGKGWGTAARSDASAMRREGDTYNFETWVIAGRENRVKEYRDGVWRVIEGLSAEEVARRMAWNRENRRVIDLRPVLDRDGAAREVLKYITKAADFCDRADAVKVFCDAVKGARLIQTFGTWYGFNMEADFDPKHLDDWGQMKCECGLNCWERMGVFYRRDVEMNEAGRWFLRRSITHTCRGTVPRPTIRALEAPEETSTCHDTSSQLSEPFCPTSWELRR